MKTSSWIIAGLSALLLMSACVQKPAMAPDTSAADAAVIRAQVDAFVVAWNAGDADSFSQMVATDAVEMPQGQAAISGREGIVAAMSSGYDITQVQQSATVDEIVVFGDHANAYGTWRLAPIVSTGAADEVTTGKWMSLYRRNAEGSWQIWRWMWNQTSGPPIPNA